MPARPRSGCVLTLLSLVGACSPDVTISGPPIVRPDGAAAAAGGGLGNATAGKAGESGGLAGDGAPAGGASGSGSVASEGGAPATTGGTLAGVGGAAGTANAGSGNAGLRIDAGSLKDACADTIVPRGYEQAVTSALLEEDAGLPEMAKTGANYARLSILLPPASNAVASVESVRRYIGLGREHGIVLELSVNDGTAGGAVYRRADVRDALLGSEDVVTLDATGETTEANDDAWVDAARARIVSLRDAGYEHVLVIGSRVYGREPNTVLERGADVVAADRLSNVQFFVQLYWGEDAARTNYYEGQFGLTLEQALQRFSESGLAIRAGLISDDSCCGDYPWVDFESAMAAAQQLKIGWLWRDFYEPNQAFSYHATTDGKYGSWKSNPDHPYQPDHGHSVSIGHPASIANTAVRSRYLPRQRCD
jgi:hypothetical protein